MRIRSLGRRRQRAELESRHRRIWAPDAVSGLPDGMPIVGDLDAEKPDGEKVFPRRPVVYRGTDEVNRADRGRLTGGTRIVSLRS